MKISALLDEFRRRFPVRGDFTLDPGELISKAVTSHNVPNQFGVYVISSNTCSGRTVIYIGKAGTVTADGSWKEQGIRKRLTKKQGDQRRNDFFKRIMEEGQFYGLQFEWFVTFDDESKITPALAEAELLQAYFSEYGRLPKHNKSM